MELRAATKILALFMTLLSLNVEAQTRWDDEGFGQGFGQNIEAGGTERAVPRATRRFQDMNAKPAPRKQSVPTGPNIQLKCECEFVGYSGRETPNIVETLKEVDMTSKEYSNKALRLKICSQTASDHTKQHQHLLALKISCVKAGTTQVWNPEINVYEQDNDINVYGIPHTGRDERQGKNGSISDSLTHPGSR